jgi:DNA-binding NarL/FixJ family response regulator
MTTQSYTILFVDDEPWLSEPLRLSLEARGFNCLSTNNATDGWRLLEKHNIHVLVADIMMPAGEQFPQVESEVAGFHFVAAVRKTFPNVAVICLSVIGDQDKINDLKKQGVLYLRKGETPLDNARRLIESKATGRSSF